MRGRVSRFGHSSKGVSLSAPINLLILFAFGREDMARSNFEGEGPDPEENGEEAGDIELQGDRLEERNEEKELLALVEPVRDSVPLSSFWCAWVSIVQ